MRRVAVSQVDLIETYGKLAFNLDFYTDALSLEYLVPFVGSRPYEGEEEEEAIGRSRGEEEEAEGDAVEPPSRFLQKYRRLNELICEVGVRLSTCHAGVYGSGPIILHWLSHSAETQGIVSRAFSSVPSSPQRLLTQAGGAGLWSGVLPHPQHPGWGECGPAAGGGGQVQRLPPLCP